MALRVSAEKYDLLSDSGLSNTLNLSLFDPPLFPTAKGPQWALGMGQGSWLCCLPPLPAQPWVAHFILTHPVQNCDHHSDRASE